MENMDKFIICLHKNAKKSEQKSKKQEANTTSITKDK